MLALGALLAIERVPRGVPAVERSGAILFQALASSVRETDHSASRIELVAGRATKLAGTVASYSRSAMGSPLPELHATAARSSKTMSRRMPYNLATARPLAKRDPYVL